jgi:hypothetical protein
MLLWGLQDDVAHHRRRYHKAELGRLIAGAGLSVRRLTYFNTLLFPPILAGRMAMRVWRPRISSENEIGGKLSNAVLGAIFALEARILERTDLPIGVSLACVAEKP